MQHNLPWSMIVDIPTRQQFAAYLRKLSSADRRRAVHAALWVGCYPIRWDVSS